MEDVTVSSLMQLDIFKESLTLLGGKGGIERPVV